MRQWLRDHAAPVVAGLVAALAIGGLAAAGSSNFTGGNFTNSSGGTGVGTGDGTTISTSAPYAVITETAAANKALTQIGSGGKTDAYFVNACSSGTSTTCTVTNNSIATNVAMSPPAAGDGQTVTSQTGAGLVQWGQPTVDYVDGFTVYDEFLNAGTNGPLFIYNVSGTGATCAGTNASAATHPGIADCSTGTTSTGRVSTWPTANNEVIYGGGELVEETYLMIPNTSNGSDGYAFQWGCGDVINAVTQTDGCYFEYDTQNAAGHNSGNAGDWIAVCSNNGTRTAFLMDGSTVCDASFTSVAQAVSAGTLPDTGWEKLKLDINAGGTEADFYVNGTLSCKITHNIPTAAGRGCAFGWLLLKNVGTTAREVYFDWFRARQTLTTPRA